MPVIWVKTAEKHEDSAGHVVSDYHANQSHYHRHTNSDERVFFCECTSIRHMRHATIEQKSDREAKFRKERECRVGGTKSSQFNSPSAAVRCLPGINGCHFKIYT